MNKQTGKCSPFLFGSILVLLLLSCTAHQDPGHELTKAEGTPPGYPDFFQQFYEPQFYFQIPADPYFEVCALAFDSTFKAMLLFKENEGEGPSLKSMSFDFDDQGVGQGQIQLRTQDEDELSLLFITLLPQHRIQYSWGENGSKPEMVKAYPFKVGTLLPDLVLRNETEALKISTFLGHPVVLNWWATSCAPCKTEIPGLNTLVAKYPEIHFIAIVDDEEHMDNFLEATPFHYLHYFGDDSHHKILGESFPRNIILDKDGRILYNKSGANPETYKQLDAILQTL